MAVLTSCVCQVLLSPANICIPSGTSPKMLHHSSPFTLWLWTYSILPWRISVTVITDSWRLLRTSLQWPWPSRQKAAVQIECKNQKLCIRKMIPWWAKYGVWKVNRPSESKCKGLWAASVASDISCVVTYDNHGGINAAENFWVLHSTFF